MDSNNITIVNKRKKKAQVSLESKGYILLDVTCSSTDETFRKFSPFYPHGHIPVPGMQNTISASVEGIWQGLKVFENEDVDLKKFHIINMKNIKRAVGEKRGSVEGHRLNDEILTYTEARKRIYVPSYNYVLDTYLQNEIKLISGLLKEGQKVVLLDFDTNDDIEDISRPLSHASLIKQAVLKIL